MFVVSRQRWKSLTGFTCRKAKALPVRLAEVPTLPQLAVDRNVDLGVVMREGWCCDRWKFPRRLLTGSRLSWPTLAKARSALRDAERRN